MARIVIVGDGPGGLSAAVFLARGGHDVTVFGQNKTAVNFARLNNYLGVPTIDGPDFQATARGQATKAGAEIRDELVTAVTAARECTATTEAGETTSADYLILSEGKNPVLARSIGLGEEGAPIPVDSDYRSRNDRVYVIGRAARPTRSQAIISAGAGATAAVDIIAREAGKDIQDWDSIPSE